MGYAAEVEALLLVTMKDRQQVLGTQYPPSRLRPSDLLFHKVLHLKDSRASLIAPASAF